MNHALSACSRASLLPTLALLAGLGLAGCGKDSVGNDSGGNAESGSPAASFGLTRLGLESVLPRDPEEVSESIRTLVIPENFSEWSADPEDFSRQDPSEGGGVVVKSSGKRILTIPGTFDPQIVDRVRIYVAGQRTNIGCEFRRDGKATVRSPRRGLGAGKAAKWLDFDFPPDDPLAEPYDELLIKFFGDATSLLSSIELRSEPYWSPIPDPYRQPQALSIKGEIRHALALGSKTPLRTRFDVPTHGRLGFSYAYPHTQQTRGANPFIVATIDPGPEAQVQRISLRSADSEAWLWGELDLSHLEPGLDIEVLFELETKDDAVVACALGVPQLFSAPDSKPEVQPTVLVITSDTHRGIYLGVADSGVEIETPHLDALARGGVYFPDCRSSTNVTLPSHSALFTGMPARDVGVYSNFGALADAALTLSETFAAQGYLTLASISNASLFAWNGLAQGFDQAVCVPALGGVPDAEQTIDAMLKWLPEAEDRPVFAWLHFFDAHFPYAPPKSHDRYYYPDDKDPFDESLDPLDLPDRALPGEIRDLRDLAFPEAQYRAEITYLDDQLARVFELPRIQQGIVAFTADHGELFGEGQVWFSHAALYPGNLHVPLILSYPGAEAGQRIGRTVRQTDVGRTILDLAGLEQASFPGQNIFERLETAGAPDDPQFAISAQASSASVTRGTDHLMLALRPTRGAFADTWKSHEHRLFDLATDPMCLNDQAEQQPELATELHRLLCDWLRDARTESWAEVVELNAAAIEHLEKLGYMEDEDDSFIAREFFPESCDCERCAARAPK